MIKPKIRWEDTVKRGVEALGGKSNWNTLAIDRDELGVRRDGSSGRTDPRKKKKLLHIKKRIIINTTDVFLNFCSSNLFSQPTPQNAGIFNFEKEGRLTDF